MSDADGSPATDAAQPPAFTPILSQQDLDAVTTPLQTAAAEAQTRLTAMTGERDAALERATAADKTASELRDQLATAIKSAAIREAAHGAGCIDIDTAAMLVADKVTVGDDGKPAGAAEALAALKAAKPHLFRPAGAGSRDASSHGPASGNGSADDWLRSLL